MRSAVLILFMATASAALSTAGETIVDTVGDWDILRQATEDEDCALRKEFADGLVLEAGFVSRKDGAFLAAYHPDWSDIVVGETVFMAFHFGDVGFGGDVEAVKVNDLKGGYAFFDNPAFTEELARRDELKITGPDGDITKISLSGTSRAITAVKACQSARQP